MPTPGVELKLVPNEGKLEARLRGPHITPGYWRQHDLTRDAFDEEGFYKIGDALKFVDPSDPGKGLLFDGRIAEDFKLCHGHMGQRRTAARSLHRLFGARTSATWSCARADCDFIAALVFPDVEACRKLGGLGPDASVSDIVDAPGVRQKFAELLKKLAALAQGSSTRIARAILMADLPSMDKSEMTDKGSINQRAVLQKSCAPGGRALWDASIVSRDHH